MRDRYDVIIIGGGPAGTTCGTMLAKQGYEVLLLERSKFPRFHIGESITAFSFDAFRRLGVEEKLRSVNYVEKRGLEFVKDGAKNFKIYFLRDQDGKRPHAFQMARDKLDQVLLDNARSHGVAIFEEHLVKKVLFERERAVGVEFKDLAGSDPDKIHRVYGNWILDASGQAAIMNRQLNDNWYNDPLLENKMAVFNHWKGDIEIQNGEHELNFKLCVHKNRRDWAWYIPIDRDTVSLGVVLSQKTLKEEVKERNIEEIFYRYAEDIPFINKLLEEPTLKTIDRFRCVKDYSYRSKRYYGDHWAIVGDSAGFIDPVFSTGLQVAFNSSFALIEPLGNLIAQEDPDLSLLEDYQSALDRYYRINSVLVYLFYLSKLDNVLFHDAAYLWKNIEWASIADRLRFIKHGLRFLVANRKQRLDWGVEVLFGNPSSDNVVADLYLALSKNYDKVFRQRIERGGRRKDMAEADGD